MRRNRSVRRLFLVAVAASLGTPVVFAELPVVQWSLESGIQYSDNVLRTEDDPISSIGASIGVNFGAVRKVGRIRFNAFGDFEYIKRFENSVVNDHIGRLAAFGTYSIIPEKVEWYLAGDYEQIRPDLARPNSPDNREDVVSWATGPKMMFAIAHGLQADLTARFGASSYSKRPLDNKSFGGEFVVGTNGRFDRYLAIGVGAHKVEFDSFVDPGAVNFRREEAFARTRLESGKTTIAADAGFSRIEGGGVVDDGPLVRVRLSRKLGAFLTAYGAYLREFPLSSNSTGEAGQAFLPNDESSLSAAPHLTQRGSVGLVLRRRRTSIDLGYYRTKELGSLGVDSTREWDEWRGGASRRMTPTTTGTLFASVIHERFPVEGFTSSRRLVGLRLEVAVYRELSIVGSVERREGSSTLISDRFHEFRAGLYLRYGQVDDSAATGGATAPL